MSKNNDQNNATLQQGSSEDAQGRWWEMLSPTQVLTGQQQNSNLDQEKQQKKKNKKKCHGNRKEQHKRHKLRHQHQKLNDVTNTANSINENIVTNIQNVNNNNNNNEMEEDKENESQLQNNEQVNPHELRLGTKRKRLVVNNVDNQVSRSLSQLSIIQRNSKKRKPMRRNNQSNNDISNALNHNNHTTEENNITLPTHNLQQYQPHYLRVSNQGFKQKLSNAIENGNTIIQCLDSNEKLQCVRQITEKISQIQYLDLQNELWQEYCDLSTKEDRWPLRLSKSFAKQHQTCRVVGCPKHIIEQRQKTIQQQHKRVTKELQSYMAQLEQCAQQPQLSLDPATLLIAIQNLVNTSQQRLKQEFKYKKAMLHMNLTDHHLITQFYNLQPSQEQICLAKKIWQTTTNLLKTKEQEEILRKRVFLRRLPNAFDKVIDQSMDYVKPMLSNQVMNKDRRASLISNYSKTITQYKFDLMGLNLDGIQNIIRGYEKLLQDLRNELSQISSESITEAIDNRQQAMNKRHELYLQHKLMTFFDEAPAAKNE